MTAPLQTHKLSFVVDFFKAHTSPAAWCLSAKTVLHSVRVVGFENVQSRSEEKHTLLLSNKVWQGGRVSYCNNFRTSGWAGRQNPLRCCLSACCKLFHIHRKTNERAAAYRPHRLYVTAGVKQSRLLLSCAQIHKILICLLPQYVSHRISPLPSFVPLLKTCLLSLIPSPLYFCSSQVFPLVFFLPLTFKAVQNLHCLCVAVLSYLVGIVSLLLCWMYSPLISGVNMQILLVSVWNRGQRFKPVFAFHLHGDTHAVPSICVTIEHNKGQRMQRH